MRPAPAGRDASSSTVTAHSSEPGIALSAFAIEPDWRGRLFAVLRYFLFNLLFGVASIAVAGSLRPLKALVKGHDERYLLNTALMAVSVIALTVLLSLLSRRHNLRYGLGGDRRWQNFAVGVFLGLGFLAAQLAAMFLLHVYAFGTGRSIDAALAYDAVLYAALFLAVAVLEETTFRGYALVELSRAISFWPAALVMAVLFGVPHALQAGDNALGGFEAGIFGFAAAVAFRYTGSLWLAIGFHAAWDYGESFIFGVPDSGQFAAGRLLHPAIRGPDWLSGGSAGPEGSALATLPMLALIAFVWLRHRSRPAAITA